jgi:nitrate reductase delta subunit
VSDYQNALEAWLAERRSPAGSGAMPESFRIRPMLKRSPEHVATLERVREWTRDRFGLGEDDAVLVSEVSCALPGCPPIETVVAFWTEGDRRHHFKIFKPVGEVAPDDLPPAFMKNALLELDGFDSACC